MSGSRGRRARQAVDEAVPAPNLRRGFLFAGLAAIAGALLWAGIAYSMHRELGFVAWAMGGFVGGACVLGGGHGRRAAWIAALLAIASLVAGKYFGYRLITGAAVDAIAVDVSVETYEEMREDSRLWHQLGPTPTTEQVEAFIVDRGYDAADAATFLEHHAPLLVRFHVDRPTIEQVPAWTAGVLQSHFSFFDYLVRTFGLVSLVFAVLGVVTAAGIVEHKSADLRGAARAARRRREQATRGLARRAAARAAQDEAARDEVAQGDPEIDRGG